MGLFDWLDKKESKKIKPRKKIIKIKISPWVRFEYKAKNPKVKDGTLHITDINGKTRIKKAKLPVKAWEGFNKEEMKQILDFYKGKPSSDIKVNEELKELEMIFKAITGETRREIDKTFELIERAEAMDKEKELEFNEDNLGEFKMPIATRKWLNLSYLISYPDSYFTTEKREIIEKTIKNIRNLIENIGVIVEPNKRDLEEFHKWEKEGKKSNFYMEKILNGKILGFSNPNLVGLSFKDYTEKLGSEIIGLGYGIKTSFKVVMKKNRGDVWIKISMNNRPKEKRDSERDCFKEIPPFKENWNYSPESFISNRHIIYELTKQISAFGVKVPEKEETHIGLNENGKPTMLIVRGTLVIAYLVKDRIALMMNCPTLEKSIFGNRFEECLKDIKNKKPYSDMEKEWIKEVDNILEGYKI